ncbi:hypothetical protein HY946_01865, partial [Candidatus Gottesmanbacteria bacterium]|nr:hypothetical protein [Candidatus Gottesmanbacteria bacterium]
GVIPVGAKNITNDLAIGLRVSLESAEKIKLALSQKKLSPSVIPEEKNKKEEGKDDVDLTDLGLPEELKKASRRTLVEGIIKPRLAEIFTLVGLELQKSGMAGATPAGIVVTGAGAETVGITETAKQRLSLPVRIGSPTGLNGLVDELQGPSSACAVGLVLYGAKKENSESTGLPLFRNVSGTLGKIPIGGIAKRIIDLLKSFLP